MKNFWYLLAGVAVFGAVVGAVYHDVVCMAMNLVALAFDIAMIEATRN
jgi:hypothetical protein